MPIYKMCRICLSEDRGRMQPLFQERNERCIEIVQRIQVCSGIVLKVHEEFPKKICFQCLDSLNTSYKFRLLCQSSEQALLDAIVKAEMKVNVKTEPQDNVEYATTSHSSGGSNLRAPVDDADEIFFDLRGTDFIETQDVDFEDMGGGKEENLTDDDDFFAIEEVDMDENDEIDGEEHLDDSDTENELEKLIDDDEFVPIPKKKKLKTDINHEKTDKVKREGEKPEKPNEKVKGRPRKKADAEPETNICEICGNIYAKRSLLNMHMRRHRSEKPFECEICGKQFTCPSEIGRHIRIHTGEKPYVCRFCGRTFADRSTNIKHERIHTNERPFTCQTCGKSFTYSNVLKNHMLTHTGEKPFPCIPCNKTFSRKHQLDQHLSTITHQQTVKNLLPQAQDGTEFKVQIAETNKHQLEHHLSTTVHGQSVKNVLTQAIQPHGMQFKLQITEAQCQIIEAHQE